MTHQIGDKPAIEITGLNKWYGAVQVLFDVNLTIKAGERLVICGPSGSGKSTLIRTINALEGFQQGDIRVDGVQLNRDQGVVEDIRRRVGMVFQQFNLFPHLTVLETAPCPFD
jgi:ABC-type polar amino acid transport system ATPase subunit